MKNNETQLKRGAGILLPVSSLPSNYGIGTFGKEAYNFIDFLKAAGQKYWQVLPMGATGFGDSPYQSFSAFAGNPYFIDLDMLADEGLLNKNELAQKCANPAEIDYSALYNTRFDILRKAFSRSGHKTTAEYDNFVKQNSFWLKDYCLYMAVKGHFNNLPWLMWNEDIRLRKPSAVKKYREMLNDDIEFWAFVQFKFTSQWKKLKAYAVKKHISIIGDIPIYVALDSADVWANPELFELDENRVPTKVAGVPPDLFSKTGQLWGNPLYNWSVMEQDDFKWWQRRVKHNAKLYDVIRIDHFIGICRFYSIPYDAENAMNGRWRKGPRMKLIGAVDKARGKSKIIAEDLGVMHPTVERVLKRSGYPGMKVLMFAFDGDSTNGHLPHNYTENSVVYGGTHDNETIAGMYAEADEKALSYLYSYLNISKKSEIPSAMLRCAYASVASAAIFQAQDILALDNSARMNFPSTIGGNWQWRLLKGQLDEALAKKLRALAKTYGR